MAGPGGLPRVVAHADWGVGTAKRWVAVAVLGADGRYRALAPRPVGRDGPVLERLGVPRDAWRDGVGARVRLPDRTAAGVRAADRHHRLPGRARRVRPGRVGGVLLGGVHGGGDRPAPAVLPAETGDQGRAARRHLCEALGLDPQELLRRCDRPGAEALFWALGGRQLGKAAIDGWRTVLAPSLADPQLDVALWPFDGELDELVAAPGMVVAETWPRECYRHLGVSFTPVPGSPHPSKRRQEDRRRHAAALLAWAMPPGPNWTPGWSRRSPTGSGRGRERRTRSTPRRACSGW
jgi:hypothetical protein